MVEPADALPGHREPIFSVGDTHAVLGSSLTGPWAAGSERIYLAMGCFWGPKKSIGAYRGAIH